MSAAAIRYSTRRLERLAVGERGLEHAGTGLGVQALDRKAHRLAEVEELLVKVGMHGVPEHRVAEGARRHRLQVAIALLAYRLGRLGEHEELEFRRGADRVAERAGPLEHAPERAARADGLGAAGEFGEEDRGLRLEQDLPPRRRQP